jgi:hypothetical protein
MKTKHSGTQAQRALVARITARAAIVNAADALPDNAIVDTDVASAYLGYNSPEAFREALRGGRVPVKPEPRAGRKLFFRMRALRAGR